MQSEKNTKICVSVNRLLIKTPEQFEQLKAGEIGATYLAIFLEPSIHANILNEVKQLSHDKHREVRFYDEHENEAIIYPKMNSVVATLVEGRKLITYLPTDYQYYQVHSKSNVLTTSADIDAILQWRTAKQITLINDNPLDESTVELFQRARELSALSQLNKLILTVHSHSYRKLDVNFFLNRLPSLSAVEFVAGNEMTTEEFHEFVDHQAQPYAYDQEVEAGRVIYKNHL